MAGRKNDQCKPRPDFIDPLCQFEEGAAMAFGAVKYDEWNYTQGMGWQRLLGASMRHTLLFACGIDIDDDSGLSHISLARASLGMLYTHWRCELGKDNRIPVGRETAKKHVDRIMSALEKGILKYQEESNVQSTGKPVERTSGSTTVPEDPTEPITL